MRTAVGVAAGILLALVIVVMLVALGLTIAARQGT